MRGNGLERLKRLSGAIFDLDGTLLDTMTQWNALGLEYLRSRGVEAGPELTERLSTMSLRQSAEFFRSEYGLKIELADIVETMKSRLIKLYNEEAALKPGARESLRLLRERGVRTAIATATSAELATAGLRRNDALDFFGALFSCKDPGIRVGKAESAKVYDVAREFLGTPLDETIVVEDALHAVETAKRAGYFVVAIYDPTENRRKETIRQIADVYCDDYFAFADWLRETSTGTDSDERRQSSPGGGDAESKRA